MTVLSLGLVRGVVAQVVGTVLGMALVMGARLVMGADPQNIEPVVVVGSMVGIIAFLVGAGSFSDWFKWAKGQETPMHHGPPEGKPAWTRYFGVDYNHRVIGVQYLVTGIMMVLVGGALASIFRLELAQVGRQFLDPAVSGAVS